MAAGHATFLSRPTSLSSTGFFCSRFSSLKLNKKLVTRVKLHYAHTPCAALVVSPKVERENSVVSVPRIEAPSGWNFRSLEFREDKDAEDTAYAVRSKSKEKLKEKNMWEVLNAGAGGSPTDISAKLPWMDPSLRYANVMWFKGAYNAQIFVSPGESEDSIVKRFRHAVAGSGVLRECYRRRYRETPQDVIKRKQRQAAFHRKRRRQYDNNSTYAYKFPKESSGHSKKKKKKKESRTRPGWDAGKKSTTEKKTDDSDVDDFWGYTEEDDGR